MASGRQGSSHHQDAHQPKRFLQPCLLLLIAECPGHGYDLLDRLAEFGFERDPGGLYRALRSMEHEGLLQSEWQHSEAGPGRRRYGLTAAGEQRLRAWAQGLEETLGVLERYLDRCRHVRQWQLTEPAAAAWGIAIADQ
jgi:poly-beta-hydroxybutyrate-responsive repressor